MKLEFNGDVWVNTETGEIYSQKQIEEFSNAKLLNDHREYVKRSVDYGAENEYKLTPVSRKENDKRTVKERHKFNMIHRTDLKRIMLSGELSLHDKGFIGCLSPFISYPENDVKINNEYLTKKDLGKFIGFSEAIMSRVIKSLKEKEIIKVVEGGRKPSIIYFNPFLYSSGREVSTDTYNMFIESKYNPNLSRDMNNK